MPYDKSSVTTEEINIQLRLTFTDIKSFLRFPNSTVFPQSGKAHCSVDQEMGCCFWPNGAESIHKCDRLWEKGSRYWY